MKKPGGKVNLYDKSVLMWHNGSYLEGLNTIHADDFEYCGTSSWHKNVINKLCQMFKISKKEKGSFKYVGLDIKQNGDEILLINKHMWMDLKRLQLIKKENNN